VAATLAPRRAHGGTDRGRVGLRHDRSGNRRPRTAHRIVGHVLGVRAGVGGGVVRRLEPGPVPKRSAQGMVADLDRLVRMGVRSAVVDRADHDRRIDDMAVGVRHLLHAVADPHDRRGGGAHPSDRTGI